MHTYQVQYKGLTPLLVLCVGEERWLSPRSLRKNVSDSAPRMLLLGSTYLVFVVARRCICWSTMLGALLTRNSKDLSQSILHMVGLSTQTFRWGVRTVGRCEPGRTSRENAVIVATSPQLANKAVLN